MKTLLFVLLTFFVFSFINATIIIIPADYTTIQAGINASVAGDTVLVQPGAYVENIDFSGKDITVASYFLTLQDSSLIEQTLILGTGSTCVVKFDNNETNNAKLIGFTISGGSGYQKMGGGIYCDYSSPTLSNLIVSQNHIDYTNSTSQGGGGIYLYYSSAIITYVTVKDNTVSNANGNNCGGGGMYLNSSSAIITYVTVKDNTVSNNYENINPGGGGIYLYYSSYASLINLIIQGNSLTSTSSYQVRGGGIYLVGSLYASLVNLIIQGNSITSTSAAWGGGLYLSGSDDVSLNNLTICDNIATSTSSLAYGGGLYLESSHDLIMDNLVINENSISGSYVKGSGIYASNAGYNFKNTEISDNYCLNGTNKMGGGIFLNSGSLSLTNTTITDNSDDFEGSGIYNVDGAISITNSIIWNDDIMLETNTSNLSVSYCDIEGGQTGIINNNNAAVYWLGVNLDVDPLFVDAINGDYHLTVISPCIDAGSPYSPYDPDGTIVDMGAYYYDQSGTIFPPIANFYANPLQGDTPLNVEFINQSVPGSGAILEWKWYFGDGDSLIIGNLTNPNHVYQNPGIFTVSLTVTDEYDSTDTEIRQDYITVYAEEPPAAPTNINIEVIGDNALITWNPVDSTIYGNPIIVDFYIVMFSEIANQDSLFFYLNYTPNTYYYHNGVALFREHMFYRVSSFIGTSDELEEYVERYLRKSKEIYLNER